MQNRSNFNSLPREIRDHIYRELYLHDQPVAIVQPLFHLPVRSQPGFSLALARTNSQIHEEVMEMLLGRNIMRLDLYLPAAIDFLSALPANVTRFVSSILLGRTLMNNLSTPQLTTRLIDVFRTWTSLRSISVTLPDQISGDALRWHRTSLTTRSHDNSPAIACPITSTGCNFSWNLLGKLVDLIDKSNVRSVRLVYNHELPLAADAPQVNAIFEIAAVLRVFKPRHSNTQKLSRENERIEKSRAIGSKPPAITSVARRRNSYFLIARSRKTRWERYDALSVERLRFR